jgi:hypothetical protein
LSLKVPETFLDGKARMPTVGLLAACHPTRWNIPFTVAALAIPVQIFLPSTGSQNAADACVPCRAGRI